jgi:hypothetical protein
LIPYNPFFMDLLRQFLRTTRSAGSSSGIRSFIDTRRVLIIFVQVDHSAGEFVGEVVNYDTYTREIIFHRRRPDGRLVIVFLPVKPANV